MATLTEVRIFLQEFKEEASQSGIVVIPTEKNIYDLMMLDLMPHQREAIMLGLEPEDYCEGPKADDGGYPGDVWIFGKLIDRITVYIKSSCIMRQSAFLFMLLKTL
jgi:hypothetical protein